MSDFDREAERKRLREKYEQDQKERAATERMSELLLQGATMTNAHCSECGDPIFRYDGQEFCATCERPVDRGNGTESDQTTGTDAGDGGNDTTGVEVTSPRDDATVVFGDEGASTSGPANGQEVTDSPRDRAETQQPQQTETDRARERAAGTEQGSSPGVSRSRAGNPAEERTRPDAPESSRDRSGDAASGGVEAARASLVRTLTAFSRRAEQTEDPQRARDQLQAAREAAETLAALRR